MSHCGWFRACRSLSITSASISASLSVDEKEFVRMSTSDSTYVWLGGCWVRTRSMEDLFSFPAHLLFPLIFNSRLQKDFHISVVKMLQNWLGTLFWCRKGKKKSAGCSFKLLAHECLLFPFWFPWFGSSLPVLLGPEQSRTLESAQSLFYFLHQPENLWHQLSSFHIFYINSEMLTSWCVQQRLIVDFVGCISDKTAIIKEIKAWVTLALVDFV